MRENNEIRLDIDEMIMEKDWYNLEIIYDFLKKNRKENMRQKRWGKYGRRGRGCGERRRKEFFLSFSSCSFFSFFLFSCFYVLLCFRMY